MNTTTRRTVIAGAATLPLLPAAALAAPVTLPLSPLASYAMPAESDPVVVAFREWRTLDAECKRMNGVYQELEDRFGGTAKEAEDYWAEFVNPTYDRLKVTSDRISKMAPVTVAGLAAQLTIAVGIYGCGEGRACYDTEDRLLLAALAGAERIAGEGV